MKRVVCFHLFNDYSGSPKVLFMVLKGLLNCGYRVDLVSTRGGVLDELDDHPYLHRHFYRYAFSNCAVLTMLRYVLVQLYTFFFSFRYLFIKDCLFYINTLLPVGPALAGRIMGKRVVYHYHENASIKSVFYKVLARGMQQLSHRIVCVSAYQASFLKRSDKVVIVPNALPEEFVERLCPNPILAYERKTVLMLSSLKDYKGTREFVQLAKKLPKFKFVIVINDSQEKIEDYMNEKIVYAKSLMNLQVYARQSDVSTFYNNASLVINLTDSSLAVETFGLTALEAMSAGLPVIVPTVGGIAELVEDGVNGYRIDVQNLDKIGSCIETVLSNEEIYCDLAKEALCRSKVFSEEEMIGKIIEALRI